MWIADPNYPSNNYREIKFVNGKFQPYNSGANAEEIAKGNGKSYDLIRYLAKSAAVSWPTLRQRWEEVKKGTIGSDRFPAYQLKYKDADGKLNDIVEGLVVDGTKFDAYAFPGGISIKILRDGKDLPYDKDWKIDLVPGNNLLGFYVQGKVGDSYEYVDFKYINVVSGVKPVGNDAAINYRNLESYFGNAANPIPLKLAGTVKGDPGLRFEGAEFYKSYAGWSNVLAFVYSIPANAAKDTLDLEGVRLQFTDPAQKVFKITGTKPWSAYTTQTIDITATWGGQSGGKWTGGPTKKNPEGTWANWNLTTPINGTGLVMTDASRAGEGIAWSASGALLFNWVYDYTITNTYRDMQTNVIGTEQKRPVSLSEVIAIRLVKR
jgi:hypothetical protein